MLGRYSGAEWDKMRYEHHILGIGRKPSPRPTANPHPVPNAFQVTTYTVGSLAVHSFSVPTKSLAVAGRLFIKEHDLLPIWPPAIDRITWPGSPVLGDVELRAIASGFCESLNPVPWDL